MEIIQSNNAPKAIGPYAQALVANGFLFASGQIGIDPKTGTLVSGIEAQTKQIMKNITAILFEKKLSLGNVVKTTIFLTNIADFATVNTIYAEAFGTHTPARSTVAVASLPKDALLEIEVIALMQD